MRIHFSSRRLTVLELAIVLTVLATLASLLCPILLRAQPAWGNSEKDRQAQCNSNIRQIALAIQMYVQDNASQYPGIDGSSWVSKVASYLGNAAAMFQCPSNATVERGGGVSYALSGLLIRTDGTGIKEAHVYSPSEVGAVCDASPTETYPAGRIIGGGGMQTIETIGAVIEPRHDKGAIVGFCDGHAKYYQGSINLLDEANGAVRALYHAAPLGLIENPAAMLPAGTGINGLTGTVTIGGEYVTYPFLMAAAKVYGSYYTRGFNGQYHTMGRPSSAWVWGTAGTGSDTIASRAIAYDAVCIIVARGSKIPSLPAMDNQTYAMPPSAMHKLFQIGYQQDIVQVYHLPGAFCITNAYVKKVIGNTNWGTDSIEVANDAEMVEKVSNDPYGIGYCSSAFADPDRVVILAPIIGGTTYVWPRSSEQFRWVMPAYAESDWPWKRSLDVACSPDKLGTGITAALRTGAFVKQGLYPGPLFTWGYWPGNY